MTTEPSATPTSQTLRVGLPAVLILCAVGAVVVYLGVRPASEGRQPPGSEQKNHGADAPRSPVTSITLPFEEPALPPGPHQRDFQVACTVCHSTRLVMTQPPFTKAQWTTTVKKMVDTYGAPLSPADQAKTVEYLTAVLGKQ
jgi:hypothetical protein